jgi:hypothetical protein
MRQNICPLIHECIGVTNELKNLNQSPISLSHASNNLTRPLVFSLKIRTAPSAAGIRPIALSCRRSVTRPGPSRQPHHVGPVTPVGPDAPAPGPEPTAASLESDFKKMIEFSLNSGLSLCLNLDCLGLNLGLNLGYLGLNLTWNLGLNFEFRLLRFELQIVFSLFMF